MKSEKSLFCICGGGPPPTSPGWLCPPCPPLERPWVAQLRRKSLPARSRTFFIQGSAENYVQYVMNQSISTRVQVIGFLKNIVSEKECRQRFNRHLSAIWYRWDDLELDDHSILRVSVRPHMASQIPQNRIQQADLDIIACSI